MTHNKLTFSELLFYVIRSATTTCCESNILSDLSLLFLSHSPQHKIFITSPNFCYWISTPITFPSCTFPRFPLSKIEASPHYSFFQLIHLKDAMLSTIKNITSLLLNSHTFGYILMVSCQINKYLVYSCCFVVLTTSVNTIVPPMFPTIKYRSLNPLEVVLMIHFNSQIKIIFSIPSCFVVIITWVNNF